MKTKRDQYTLRDEIPEYLLNCRTEGKSLRTIDWYEQKLRYFASYMESNGLSLSIEEIGPREIRRFVSHLQGDVLACSNNPYRPTQDKPLSPQTVAGYVRTLRAFFSWAVRDDLVASNPMRLVKTPKVPQRDMPFFSDEEVLKILAALEERSFVGRRNHTMALILFDTGLRVSELIGLTMDAVHLDQGYVTVVGKGDKERSVPLGRNGLKALKNYIHRVRPRGTSLAVDHVFLTNLETPLKPDYVYKIISSACRKAGIQRSRLGPHTCRHTFARSFLLNGGSLLALQRILGHTSLEVVRLYVNLQTTDLVEQQRRYSPMDTLTARSSGPNRGTGGGGGRS